MSQCWFLLHIVAVEENRPSSPQRLVFSMATLDIVEGEDDQLEFVPLVDHGIDREDIAMAEQEISERSAHGGYQTDPILMQENQRHHEMLEELIGKIEPFTMSDKCNSVFIYNEVPVSNVDRWDTYIEKLPNLSNLSSVLWAFSATFKPKGLLPFMYQRRCTL